MNNSNIGKRVTNLAVLGCMVFVLAACGGGGGKEKKEKQNLDCLNPILFFLCVFTQSSSE